MADPVVLDGVFAVIQDWAPADDFAGIDKLGDLWTSGRGSSQGIPYDDAGWKDLRKRLAAKFPDRKAGSLKQSDLLPDKTVDELMKTIDDLSS